MNSIKCALSLYMSFLKIGCITFGGGLNIIAQIQRVYVDQKKWMTQEELLDIYCVGKCLPGTMVTNVSYLFGYQVGGAVCGVCCVLGLITAPAAILAVVAVFYNSFHNNPYIYKFMLGVRAAVVPIILAAVLNMLKAAFPHWKCILIAIGAYIMFSFFGTNSLIIILISGVLGLMMTGIVNQDQT